MMWFNFFVIATTIIMATIHVINVALYLISHARGNKVYGIDFWLFTFPVLIAANLMYLIYEA